MRVKIRPHQIEQLQQLRSAIVGSAEGGALGCARIPSSSGVWSDVSGMRLPRSLAAALYNNANHLPSRRNIANMEKPEFRPKKVLILSKLTRYEFEKKVNKGIHDEKQLAALLKRRGSDYERLLAKHNIHHAYLNTLQEELQKAGVESRLVRRFDYTQENVDWADAVFSAGGDGTFLMAASKIRHRNKPVIGINTDPQGSEGYMCLMRKLPKEHLQSALHRLFKGDFEWLFRQRIRITVSGDNAFPDAIELHDQQLNRDPSTTRWTDNPRSPARHEEEGEHMALTQPVKKKSKVTPPNLAELAKLDGLKTSKPAAAATTNGEAKTSDAVSTTSSATDEEVELPVLALNEVFIGESLSSRVSYYEISVDGGKMLKQKSSGITICTGTGSTSWYFNINKLTEHCVEDLMKIIADQCKVKLPVTDKDVISEVCTKFNQQLIFSPDRQKLAFSVRDPVFNATFPPTEPRGFADHIRIKSRGYDAHLVIDGGISYRFNDGCDATMEVLEEDALRTVVFR